MLKTCVIACVVRKGTLDLEEEEEAAEKGPR